MARVARIMAAHIPARMAYTAYVYFLGDRSVPVNPDLHAASRDARSDSTSAKARKPSVHAAEVLP